MDVQALDPQLPVLETGTAAAVYGVENATSEVEDLLSYCNDILDLGTNPKPPVSQRPVGRDSCFSSKSGGGHICIARYSCMKMTVYSVYIR